MHVREGSPRAALVIISATYTGFTQLFAFHTATAPSSHATHPSPQRHRHIPQTRQVFVLFRALERAAAHSHFQSHLLSADAFVLSIATSKNTPTTFTKKQHSPFYTTTKPSFTELEFHTGHNWQARTRARSIKAEF